MKTIKSINIRSAVIYSAILAGFWTLVFSVIYWILGWIFGASSAYINMNLGNWTVYTMGTFIAAVGRALVPLPAQPRTLLKQHRLETVRKQIASNDDPARTCSDNGNPLCRLSRAHDAKRV